MARGTHDFHNHQGRMAGTSVEDRDAAESAKHALHAGELLTRPPEERTGARKRRAKKRRKSVLDGLPKPAGNAGVPRSARPAGGSGEDIAALGAAPEAILEAASEAPDEPELREAAERPEAAARAERGARADEAVARTREGQTSRPGVAGRLAAPALWVARPGLRMARKAAHLVRGPVTAVLGKAPVVGRFVKGDGGKGE